jgi:hypothetical protein
MSERYRVATKAERGALLNAFCLARGYERKHAIKVLGGRRRKSPVSLVRRRRRYGLEFQRALQVAWEAAGYLCAERLQPFLPDLLPLLKCHGHLDTDAQTAAISGWTAAQLEWLDRLYTELLRQYNNCFQPTLKAIGKRQVGERTRKLYDRPRTPLQRLLDSGAADPTKIPTLVDLYTAVSPLALKLPERQDLH